MSLIPIFYQGNTQIKPLDITLFDSDLYLNLSITFPFDSILNNSQEKKISAILTFQENSAITKNLSIKLSSRGNFRKKPENCSFPPLHLYFSNNVSGTVFEGLNKIKLVTHCSNIDSLFEQYVLEEYYLYRIYNLLTYRSFKVRLARIKYMDIKGQYPSLTRWGFFVENPENLAYRINGEILNFIQISPKAVNAYHYELMHLFQTMIINNDWSVGLLHNIELIGIYPDLKPNTIPFDFDMAGIIKIPYNSPSVAFRKDEKATRNYSYKIYHSKEYKLALQKVKNERQHILNLFITDSLLNFEYRNNFINSLLEFYKTIDK